MSDKPPRPPAIGERIAELYRRLRSLARAASAESALRQLCETLEQVEDDVSGISKQTPPPPPQHGEGRMYCPQDDHITRNADGSILTVTRGHRIDIGADGSLRILNRVSQEVE